MKAAPLLLAGWWLAAVALLVAGRAQAIEPEQREAVVISGRVWEGFEYREIVVPSTKADMTLIAGRASAISFVRTLEYYWPLARQVYVDFERQRDLIEGELVVRRNGEEIAREAFQPYSIDFPEGAARGNGHLIWGDEAERTRAEYQEGERRFTREYSAAQRAHAAYERRLLETGAARKPGEVVEPIEPPPPLPRPSLRLVTIPTPAFRIELEPGDYELALERGGRIVPGTERRLHVIGLSGSETLVTEIVPAERWTRPLASNIGEARIFARPGAVFYLTLIQASRFDEADYLPVVSPQAEPVVGRSVWIKRKPSVVQRVNLSWDGADSAKLLQQSFKVEQTEGSGFGYRVRMARDGERSDLDAFAVDVASDPSVTRGSITIAGQSQPPFLREVVVVHPRRAGLGLALALLPFVAYLALVRLRRFAGRWWVS
jgi:hypothetical protein